ncbi:MAG TPA: carbohydrate kinase family protein [Anaerolineaceae bacterium]|nr:carbohydrate kinase family protein [Anaerolineaceae bacterium]
MPVICTGSIAYDYLMTFPGYFKDHILAEHLDKLSLSFLVDSMVRQRGGTAPNIAYSLALLGETSYLVGTVGEDFEDYRAWMEKNGVNTEYTRVIPGLFTASFFANTDRSNAQISSFYPGAMAEAGRIHMSEMVKLNPELVVISPNDPGAMHQYALECSELGLPYLYDPSQQIVRMSAEQLRFGAEHAHCLFVNDYEYQLLQKHTGLSEDDLLKNMRFMVVTLGKDGANIYADGHCYHTPVVPPQEILDPTGVGDAFRGGFLRGLRLGLGWETCGKMGALAATYCLEQRGTQSHHYLISEFIARFRQHFDDQGELDRLTR